MKFFKKPVVIIAIIVLLVGSFLAFEYFYPAQNHIVDWSKLSTDTTRIEARVNDTITVKIYQKASVGLTFVEAALVQSTCVEEISRKQSDTSNGLLGGDSIETTITYKVVSSKFCALNIVMDYRGEKKNNTLIIN